jgi:hypothetical protein
MDLLTQDQVIMDIGEKITKITENSIDSKDLVEKQNKIHIDLLIIIEIIIKE